MNGLARIYLVPNSMKAEYSVEGPIVHSRFSARIIPRGMALAPTGVALMELMVADVSTAGHAAMRSLPPFSTFLAAISIAWFTRGPTARHRGSNVTSTFIFIVKSAKTKTPNSPYKGN